MYGWLDEFITNPFNPRRVRSATVVTHHLVIYLLFFITLQLAFQFQFCLQSSLTTTLCHCSLEKLPFLYILNETANTHTQKTHTLQACTLKNPHYHAQKDICVCQGLYLPVHITNRDTKLFTFILLLPHSPEHQLSLRNINCSLDSTVCPIHACLRVTINIQTEYCEYYIDSSKMHSY